MLEGLTSDFDCCYIDKIGHADAFPVNDNWGTLVDELVDSVKAQSNQPVVALGHSLGGVLSLLAALKAPELFKAVVLLDSPLLSRGRSRAVQLAKKTGFIDRITPAYRTRARRTHWTSREEAFAYLKRRVLFQHITDACLSDYIDYGMTHDETGCSLRFDASIEYQIYRTIPHTLRGYAKHLQVPTALIYGDASDVIYPADRRYMKRRYNITSYQTKGTHMFPLEHPKETAALILDVLAKP
jgi:pimeloyl-ACP methyl ester carboxylesterase